MNNLFVVIAIILSTFDSCNSQVIEEKYGSIESNFKGGKSEFFSVFIRKLEYPKELKVKKITGNIYYELEIDTMGNISNFKIIRALDPILEKEIKSKIYLTNGMWIPMVNNGVKINYRIIDKVYFELR